MTLPRPHTPQVQFLTILLKKMWERSPHSMCGQFSGLHPETNREANRSLLVCVTMEAKLVWPPFSRLQISQGIWVQLAIPCPDEGRRAVSYPNLIVVVGGIHGERAYSCRILLHILKLTSAY